MRRLFTSKASPRRDSEIVADWEGLGTATNHVVAERTLTEMGWTRCGAGDWAIALRSPDGALAARISPFDPTGPITAELYRRAATTGQVPQLVHHTRLEGGGDLFVMEHLQPAPPEEAATFLADIAGRAPSLRVLGTIVRQMHAKALSLLPWCGPLDTNPANVMSRHDGTLVLTDPFYADGPNLYAAALQDPDRVARLISPEARRYMSEIPLAGSGPWLEGEQERIREGLRAADERLNSD